MTLPPTLIGVSIADNGFRAWAYDSRGDVIDTVRAPGIRTDPAASSADQIKAILSGWRPAWTGACPVLVSGATDDGPAAQDIERLRVPIRLEDVSAHLQDSRSILFVPGLVQASPPDMTSGSETSLFGIDQSHGLVCIPGRVTQHYSLETGRITTFTTELTREIQAAVMNNERTKAARLPEQVFSDLIFVEWAERSLDTDDAVSAFAVHAACFIGDLNPQYYECALSGLLIGADVAAHYDPGDDVILIADETDQHCYGLVLDALGADVLEYSAEECLTDGLWEVAELAGLLAD
jgi:2-dehydro-3-deoxygalactonokinase